MDTITATCLRLLCGLLILSGCVSAPETIRDVRDLPQNHAAYLNADSARALIDPISQKKLDDDFNVIYFSVWHQNDPFHALPNRVLQDFQKFAIKRGYGENKKLHPPSWIKKLRQNAALANFPNALYPAITVRNTNLRILPTVSPHFYDRDGDAWAWPFDNLQRSSVGVNTPVFVCHLSADKAWALVETDFTFGWMPADDFAAASGDFMQAWETGRYAVITRDLSSIVDDKGIFLAQASLGQIFPLIRDADSAMEILVAVADPDKNAVIRRGRISSDTAAIKPLRFNQVNASRISNELIGEPYGWGGMYGRRDCSSMTRDFFRVFGIWLPRHSADQVKEVGTYIDLEGLKPDQKEKIILEKGVPYLSLLWRKGHVMLYIGEQNGRALIFHNIWGIRTKDLRGRDGRMVIGEAVITTLEPGRELRNIDSQAGSLLQNITAMNILAPPSIATDSP
ncbi:MAG: NlpC/P60 family N-terminal domain-containing protein [Smithellaceae bacterium]